MNEFLKRLKFVKIGDILSSFKMVVALIIAPFYKMRRKTLWLVMERMDEARDNGYWFFRYLCKKHTEIDAVYVISPDSADYGKVAALGRTIRPKTLIHWIYYFVAQYNISSQKDGNPNAALCFVLENYLRMNNHRVFLQHGITQNDVKWLYYKISHFEFFSCATQHEFEFVQSTLGYPSSVTRLVGFCRYDNLLMPHVVKRQVLVMPTWREWLGRISSNTTKFELSKRFTDSEYFKVWSAFLENSRLASILENSNCQLVFYPHSNLQKYITDFQPPSTNKIIIADSAHYDIQQLLMESAALITDYSSIFFDFAYMNKPLAYYQFDYDKFRQGQYQEGYFSYTNDGFGHVCYVETDLLKWIDNIIKSNFANESKYAMRVNDFFTFRDANNCERTYKAICDLENGVQSMKH